MGKRRDSLWAPGGKTKEQINRQHNLRVVKEQQKQQGLSQEYKAKNDTFETAKNGKFC
jgi:hypothetical protein